MSDTVTQPKQETSPLRADLILKLSKVIKESSSNPSSEIRALGSAFLKIADALEGMDGKDAVLTLRVVAMMEGIEI